jgi:hypothetical protein
VEAKAQAAQNIKRIRQKGLAIIYAIEFKRRAMLLNYGDKTLAKAFYNTFKKEIKNKILQIKK